MSNRATMSLIGLYNYYPELFDDFQLPADIDRETLRDYLLLEAGEKCVLYTDPYFLRRAIGAWSTVQLPIWEKLIETTKYDYDPIENYNRYEDWSDTNDRAEKTSTKEDRTRTENIDFAADNNGDSSSTRQVAGFDVGMADAERNDSESSAHGSSTTDTTGTEGMTRTDDFSSDADSTHQGHMHGNIGVTTTQQMIMEERNVIKDFNAYAYITNDFCNRFLLYLY